MNTLLKGVLFFIGAIIFVNIMLFDILGMSKQNISFGTLLLIQISAAAIMFFIYITAIRRK